MAITRRAFVACCRITVACQHAIQAKQPQLADRLNPELPNSPLGAMLGEDAKLLEEQPSSG